MYPEKQRVPGTLQLISTLMLIAVFGLGGVFDLQAGPCAAPRLLIRRGEGRVTQGAAALQTALQLQLMRC